MGKVKEFVQHREFIGKDEQRRRVLVYGELVEEKRKNLISVTGINDEGGGCTSYEPISIMRYTKKYRSLRLGWSICQTDIDAFDREKGIHMAKKRLSKDPLTTMNPTLLTYDMVTAIVMNEVDYIINNLHKYVPGYKEPVPVDEQYIDLDEEVTIICPIHGEFRMTPRKHLEGYGCPKCENYI